MRTATLKLRAVVLVVVLAVAMAACTTSRSKTSSGPSSGSASYDGPTFAPHSQGVTNDTIKIGLSYIDLQALAQSGIIRMDNGDYEKVIKTLVDDVNANGGINGRKLEAVPVKYSAIDSTTQLTACTQLTEDEHVFAVLGGLLGDNNLCIVQQHATVLISSGPVDAATRAKAKAPWATEAADAERSVQALVKLMDQNGDLKGHTIGIYADSGTKPLLDLMANALKAAGYPPADTAWMNISNGNDLQAATAQDKVIAQRMMQKHVDTVIDVGLFTPAADFDHEGFHPRIFGLSAGNLGAAVYTNPFPKFPEVVGLQNPNPYFDDPSYVRCRQIWKRATGHDVETTQQEDLNGKSTSNGALADVCTTLDIFVAAAKAAGKNLNNQTFAQGLASLGNIDVPYAVHGSFGPHKFDAQNDFVLARFDPTYKAGSGKQQFVNFGNTLTLK
jgi:hypothetical protein